MVQRVIETDQDRRLLFRYLEGQRLPMTVEITAGKHRTNEQNRLQRKWMKEIAEQLGDRTAEEVRGWCKLHIGVPILRDQNEKFRAGYDRVIKPMSYEDKIEAMMEPLSFPVTSQMTTKQKTEYLDKVFGYFTERGIALTVPVDDRIGPPRSEAA